MPDHVKDPVSDLVCMMAKVPARGQVKTRLCPPLSAEQAAELARAFLVDTWHELMRLPDVGPEGGPGVDIALAYAGDSSGLPVRVPEAMLWPQADGDLGARIERVFERGLSQARRVVIVGSDAPGLPAELIQRARLQLGDSDAVLGPALDGGYYLIGLSRLEPDLFADLPWSSERTLCATYRRLRTRGYRVGLMPTWFDVDDVASLCLLDRVLGLGGLRAPRSSALTSRILGALHRDESHGHVGHHSRTR